jgi:hypothetical protein
MMELPPITRSSLYVVDPLLSNNLMRKHIKLLMTKNIAKSKALTVLSTNAVCVMPIPSVRGMRFTVF